MTFVIGFYQYCRLLVLFLHGMVKDLFMARKRGNRGPQGRSLRSGRVAYMAGVGGPISGSGGALNLWGGVNYFTLTSSSAQWLTLAESPLSAPATGQVISSATKHIVSIDASFDVAFNASMAAASDVDVSVGIYVADFIKSTGWEQQNPSDPADVARGNWLMVRSRSLDLPATAASSVIAPLNDAFGLHMPTSIMLPPGKALVLAVAAFVTGGYPSSGAVYITPNVRVGYGESITT
jgi:hypothetical protein